MLQGQEAAKEKHPATAAELMAPLIKKNFAIICHQAQNQGHSRSAAPQATAQRMAALRAEDSAMVAQEFCQMTAQEGVEAAILAADPLRFFAQEQADLPTFQDTLNVDL